MHENGLKRNCYREKLKSYLSQDSKTVNRSGPYAHISVLSHCIISKNTRELVHAKLVQQDIDREESEGIPKCFFADRKTGILTGKPNPLTSREIIDHCTCVIPTLLFGCEHYMDPQ